MAEYIEREALLKAVSAWRVLVKDLYDCGYDDCITAMEDTISDAPAADVEPVKHGRWINENFCTRCSACGNMTIYDKYSREVESDYCPNCGAKMEGEENG